MRRNRNDGGVFFEVWIILVAAVLFVIFATTRPEPNQLDLDGVNQQAAPAPIKPHKRRIFPFIRPR
jgi:hypothetical protein